MNMHLRAFYRNLVAGCVAATLVFPALAQSTAFTYQGELKSGGQLANGLHDLRFKLFDAASAGTQIGSTVCVNNVTVAEGKFTATIDFGQQFANTSARHLEIEVRADSGLDCTNTSGYTILSPRQPITPAPKAAAANTAFSLSAPDGSPQNSLVVSNAGFVGIGLATPQSLLHVNGTMAWGGNTTDYAWSGADTNGLFLEQAGSSAVSSRLRVQSSKSSDFVNYAQLNIDPYAGFSFMGLGTGNGNVGIGTTTPTDKLHVVGNTTINGSLFVGSGAINIPPTLRSYTIHPYELQSNTSGGGITTLNDVGLSVNGLPKQYVTSVHLPDGATIIALEVHGHAGGIGGLAQITTTLGRSNFSGGTLEMASIAATNGPSVWQTTGIVFPTIDNDTHSYWLRVLLGGNAAPSDNTLYAIRIIYQISQPLP